MKRVQMACHRVAFRRIGCILVLLLVLSTGPAFGEGRLEMQRVDGGEMRVLNRTESPAFLVPFGRVQIGMARLAGLQYTNIGGAPVTDIEVGEITGDNPDVFSIEDDNCTGVTLAPTANCLIWLRFEPDAMTDYSAEFVVTSTAVNSPELVRMTGSGIFDELFRDRFELGLR